MSITISNMCPSDMRAPPDVSKTSPQPASLASLPKPPLSTNASTSASSNTPSRLRAGNKVLEAHDKLEQVTRDMDYKMNSALIKTEKEFHEGYKIYVNQKNAEMKELVNKYKERTSKLSIKDEKIRKLELIIHDLKHQLFISEEQKENKIKEALKWKMKGEIMEQDKRFLEKQLKDARKQNRLLKIAISKMQNDFEKLASDTKHPLGVNYSLNDESKNNLLSQLDKVISEHQELGQDLSNKEVIEKLEQANNKIDAIAQTKINSFTAYTDDNMLREKIHKSEAKPESESRTQIKHSSQSYHHYESSRKPGSFSRSFRQNTRKVPVGSAQNVSAIKRKLGNDERWNRFCNDMINPGKE